MLSHSIYPQSFCRYSLLHLIILASLPSLFLSIERYFSTNISLHAKLTKLFLLPFKLLSLSLSPYTFSRHSSASMPCLVLSPFTPLSLWLHGCIPRCFGLSFFRTASVSCDVLLPHLAIFPHFTLLIRGFSCKTC